MKQIIVNKVTSGYANEVYQIKHHELIWYLKLFKNLKNYYREIEAIKQLKTLKLACPEVIFKQPRMVIFRGNGKPISICEESVKELSFLLAHQHSLTLHRNSIPLLDFDPQPNRILQRLKNLYGYEPYKLALVHGDITPENLVRDSNGLYYLIDWEEATISDPIIDLSIAIIEFFAMEKSFKESKYLCLLFETTYFNFLKDHLIESVYSSMPFKYFLYMACLEELQSWAITHNKRVLAQQYSTILEEKWIQQILY